MADSRKIIDLTVDEFCRIVDSHYDLLLSYEQVAIILKISKQKVCQLVHEKKLTSIKGFGTKCKFIRKSELERHIERINKVARGL